jgi:cobalamin biosynthesis Mg chelatase CobN
LRAAGSAVAEVPKAENPEPGHGEAPFDGPWADAIDAAPTKEQKPESGAAATAAPVTALPVPASEKAKPAAPKERDTPLVERVVRKPRKSQSKDKVPRSLPVGAVLFVAALVALLAGGVVWLLRGG